MLKGTGTGLTLVNATNGKVTVTWDSTGNPAFDDSQAETVFSLLIEPAGWFGDRNGKRTTLLPTVNLKDSSTKGKLEEYSQAALQPAVQDGRLRSDTAEAVPNGSGYLIKVGYVTGAGKQHAVTVPLSV